jgi:RNA polymerase sigma-70 factor (ECF subfamily)
MLLQHSRHAARVDAHGDLIPLEEQDRSRWDGAAIAEGTRTLQHALSLGPTGIYCVQAAIAACHAQSGDPSTTDWAQIVALYDRLLALTGSPVVALNRAVAVGMAKDPRDGLALVDALVAGGQLSGYPLVEATRADLLRRAGDREHAQPAYREALAVARSEPERRFLARRLRELGG